MDTITTALANLGIGGAFAAAILWVLWYGMTKTLPRMLDTFREEIAAERATAAEQHQQAMVSLAQNRHAIKDLDNKVTLALAVKELLAQQPGRGKPTESEP